MIQQLRNSRLIWYGWALVPMSAADQVGEVAVLAQPMEDPQRVRVDVAARNAMGFARDDDGFDHWDD